MATVFDLLDAEWRRISTCSTWDHRWQRWTAAASSSPVGAGRATDAPRWLLDAPDDVTDEVLAVLLADGSDCAVRLLVQAFQPALRRLVADLSARGVDSQEAASVVLCVAVEHFGHGRPARFALAAMLVRGIRRDAWRAAVRLTEPAVALEPSHAARIPAASITCPGSEVLDLLRAATRSGAVGTADASLVGELALTSRVSDAAARRRCSERTVRRRRDRTYEALRALEAAS